MRDRSYDLVADVVFRLGPFHGRRDGCSGGNSEKVAATRVEYVLGDIERKRRLPRGAVGGSQLDIINATIPSTS